MEKRAMNNDTHWKTYCAVVLLMAAACFSVYFLLKPDREKVAQKTVQKHMIATSVSPDSLRIMYYAPIDSAFGTNYFSDRDRDTLQANITKVAQILKKGADRMGPDGMPNFYIIDLAQRQMAGTARLGSIVVHDTPKGAFSGFKTHINYEGYHPVNGKFRAQRWYYLTKDCKSVVTTFELPLP